MFKANEAFASFSVNDIQRASEFYTQKLGLDVSESAEGLDVHLGGERVFIYPKPNHAPASFTVLTFIVDDIETAVDELSNLAVRIEKDEGETRTDEKGIRRNEARLMAWVKDR